MVYSELPMLLRTVVDYPALQKIKGLFRIDEFDGTLV